MKRILVLLTICAIASTAYSQKKPKVNKAEDARQEGNLGEAKEIVDAAIEHEKTKDDGKTWYYRGLVYASLDTTSNPEFQNLASDPLETAMEAFAKADEIDPDGNNYYVSGPNGIPLIKEQQMQQLWGYYLNEGVNAYQDSNFDDAVKYFGKTTVVLPEDTTGYIYAGSAAQANKDFETTSEYFYTLVNDLDFDKEDVYNTLIYIESSVNKDDEKALEVIRMAKEAFPKNTSFARSEINALIRMEKVDEAKASLESAIASDPNNPDLYFTLGVMQEELGNIEKAAEAYNKAIEADPDYYNAVFNLAVLNYNIAVELIKEKNNLGISSAEQKKAKEMQATIDEKLKVALPHWEKANELQPNDRTTLETMQYIYAQLKMNEKVTEIAKQLDAMGEEGGE